MAWDFDTASDSGDQSFQGSTPGDETPVTGSQSSMDDADQVLVVGNNASSTEEQSSAEEDSEPLYQSLEGTVPNLVLLDSPDSPRACIAMLAVPLYVLAPAHCMVQMSTPAEWWADFGFQVISSNGTSSGAEERDEGDLCRALVGGFKWEKHVAITIIVYQPGFLEALFNLSGSSWNIAITADVPSQQLYWLCCRCFQLL